MMQICLKSLRGLLLVLLAAQAGLLGMSQICVDSHEDVVQILVKPEVRELLEVLLEVGDESLLLDEQQRAALLSSCMQCNQGAIHEVLVCLSFIKQLICTKFALLDTHLSQVDASLCTKLVSLATTVTTGDAIICSKIDNLDFDSTSGIDQILESLSIHDASVCAKLIVMQGNELLIGAQMVDAFADATQSIDDSLESATDEILTSISIHDSSVCAKILGLEATELIMHQQLVGTLSTHDASVCTKIQNIISLEDTILQEINAFESTEQLMNAQVLTAISSHDAQVCTKLLTLQGDLTTLTTQQNDMFAILNSKIDLLLP